MRAHKADGARKYAVKNEYGKHCCAYDAFARRQPKPKRGSTRSKQEEKRSPKEIKCKSHACVCKKTHLAGSTGREEEGNELDLLSFGGIALSFRRLDGPVVVLAAVFSSVLFFCFKP